MPASPSPAPTWRRLTVSIAVAALALAALAASPTIAGDVAGAQSSTCIEAGNRAHVDAGRATRLIFTVRAVGSNDYLGSIFATTTLQQTAPGVWTRVTSCAPGSTTTTTTPGSTTSTTQGPGERPPLSQRYTAIYEEDARLSGHTVYRPQNLSAVTESMPIVVWGNGACRADGTWFQEFLQPLAAHGVLVIASGRPGGSGSTTSDMLIDAIDFAVAENSRIGSQYRGRLDVDNITAMGQSCGGLEAIDASRDPRVDSTILWNSGIFASGGVGGVGKDALTRLHGPVAWLNGGPSDIAYANALDDYQRVPSSVPAVFGAYGDVGHMAMFTDPAIEREIIGVAADWLDATLYDNATARAQFVGANCGLCSGTEWAMQSKNWG
jgi:pimeloyl-ACP methyl ester carboxylesterase